jgi:hypothetical protein
MTNGMTKCTQNLSIREEGQIALDEDQSQMEIIWTMDDTEILEMSGIKGGIS